MILIIREAEAYAESGYAYGAKLVKWNKDITEYLNEHLPNGFDVAGFIDVYTNAGKPLFSIRYNKKQNKWTKEEF